MDFVYTPAKTGYQRWMEQEGIPIVEGLAIEDVTDLALRPWKRLGGNGTYIQQNRPEIDMRPGRLAIAVVVGGIEFHGLAC